MSVRRPAVAGSFYPASPRRLGLVVRQLLDPTPPALQGQLKGLVVPHAGIAYSGQVAAKGLSLLRLRGLEDPIRIVLIGPSHSVRFTGASVSQAEAWETPLGSVPVDKRVHELNDLSLVDFPKAHIYEHCLEVVLPFLQELGLEFTIIPVLTGDIDPGRLAQAISGLLDEDSVIICSSDLSHYRSQSEANAIDGRANVAVPTLDFEMFENCEACGKTGVLALMQLAKTSGWTGHFIEYQTSGDVTGDQTQVVGYGAYAFTS